MRRRLLDTPNVVTLYNVWKAKYVLDKLFFLNERDRGSVLALNTTSFLSRNFSIQPNFQFLSKSPTQKSASVMNGFSSLIYRKSLSRFYFVANYKPIYKNCHEADAFDYS